MDREKDGQTDRRTDGQITADAQKNREMMGEQTNTWTDRNSFPRQINSAGWLVVFGEIKIKDEL